jgi:lipoate-protein ligase B
MLESRLAGVSPGEGLQNRKRWPNTVLSMEHPHVFTIGRNANEGELRFRPGQDPVDAEVYRVDRGGKITYHGPGQLVVYPLLDLTHFRKDLHWYVNTIEAAIIDALLVYGLEAHRMKGYPGVWVGDRKVAQVGMNVSKWFSTHGFAINVAPDMAYFSHIVPCGITDKSVSCVRQLVDMPSGSAASTVSNPAVRSGESISWDVSSVAAALRCDAAQGSLGAATQAQHVPATPPATCRGMLPVIQACFARRLGVEGLQQRVMQRCDDATAAAPRGAGCILDRDSLAQLDITSLLDAIDDRPCESIVEPKALR